MENNNIFFNISDNGIAELIFDFKKDSNIFDYDILLEFEKILKTISRNPNIKVLILKSNKKDFISGYDLNEINKIDYFEDAKNLSKRIKDILNKLSNLRFTTISIVKGKCLGLGIEILLSTDYRIMSNNSYLQFYEYLFKLTPLGGANISLPKIIGLENSMPYLLGQKILPSKAIELKLIHKNFSDSQIDYYSYKIALEYSNKGKYISDNTHSFKDKVMEDTKIGKKYLLSKFDKSKDKKIIEFIINSYSLHLEKSLEEDSEFFAELCESKIPKNIIDFYFMERKYIFKKKYKFKNIGIINLDNFDNSFYKKIIEKDLNIRIIDNYEKISVLQKKLSESLNIKKIISNITYSDNYKSLNFLELIILDDISLLNKIENKKIIIFNNDNIDIKKIIENYNYPELIFPISINNNLVEIIKNPLSKEEDINKVISFFNILGKKTLVFNDFYIKNIIINYLKESLLLYEENYNPNEINLIMEKFGFQKGPFKIIEENNNLKKELNIDSISYDKKDYKEIEDVNNIKNRLIFSILITSIECLEKRVVENYEQADIANIHGLSFPTHLGGVFKYIDDITITEIIKTFEYLNKKYSNRFVIPELILKMEKNKEKFYK